jgi:ABC-type nitrate/sulfonate/bicarbonate transport system ATPase subunit
MLLVTHDVDEAIVLADRVIVLRQGRIGAEFPVRLSVAERSHGPARDELRARLLAELGSTSPLPQDTEPPHRGNPVQTSTRQGPTTKATS